MGQQFMTHFDPERIKADCCLNIINYHLFECFVHSTIYNTLNCLEFTALPLREKGIS